MTYRYFQSVFLSSCLVVGLTISCATTATQQTTPETQPSAEKEPEKTKPKTFTKVDVYSKDGELLFVLLGVKAVHGISYGEEEVELVSFETSTGIDFVSVSAKNSITGIRSEYAWAEHQYPGFSRRRQSLVSIKINDRELPCDILLFENEETGEKLEIYFEIADFFGKF